MIKGNDLVFCLDTSVLIDVNRHLRKLIPNLMDELNKLFNSGKVISHKIVFNEIITYSKKRPDFLTQWIKPREIFFKDISVQQALYVADIIQKYPTLIHYKNEKDEADPWLIATVLEIRSNPDIFSILHDYVIVSTESEDIPNHLPKVCNAYSIEHYNLKKFFSAVGWNLVLQVK